MRIILVLGASLLLAASPPSSAQTALDDDAARRYIVTFAEPGLVEYRGEVSGLERIPRTGSRQRLDVRSQPAQNYIDHLRQLTEARIANAEQLLQRAIDVKYIYKATQSGFIAILRPSEAADLLAIDGVVEVAPEPRYDLATDAGPDWIKAPAVWDGVGIAPSAVPNRGEGRIVGVIDTGINSDHPSFAEMSPGDGHVHANPLGAGVFLGECDGGGFPCNNKLIGAYNFTDGPEDNDGHGSHTASTAAGNLLVGPFIDTATGTTLDAPSMSGVAPHANLVAYDACSAGCFTSAAIDQAIADGVDAISYSIGPTAGGRGISPWGGTGAQFLNAVDAGIFVSASAGNTRGGTNDNPEADVANKDPWTMTVANVSHHRTNSNVTSITGPGSPPANLMDLYGLAGTGPSFPADVVDSPIVFAGDVDAGNVEGCNAWTGTPFQNSVALISRGSCNFSVKVDNATAAGASHVVVFNHLSDNPIVMGLLEGTTIPSIMVGLTDGNNMVSFIQSNPTATVSIDAVPTYGTDPVAGDILNPGSLVGPNLDFDVTEPDIGAPGTNVFAAVSNNVGAHPQFGFKNGTSMSAPHISGSAVVLMNARPNLTVMELMSIMKMTARLGFASDGATPATWDLAGHGIVDLQKSASAALVMDETIANLTAADPAMGGDPATLNLPNVRSTSCSPNCSWTRRVRADLPGESTWTVSGSGDGFSVDVTPATFSVTGGDVLFRDGNEDLGAGTSPTSFVTLTINVTGNASGSNLVFGEVVLSDMGGTHPDQVITIAVSETITPPPPVR